MGIESSDEMADFLEHQYLTYGEIKTLDDILEKYQNHCFHTYREKKDGAITLSNFRYLEIKRNYQKRISKKPDF